MNKRNRKNFKIDIAIIIIIILVMIIGWLTSCNVVHKTFNKKRQSIDSTAVSKVITSKDSSNATSKYISTDSTKKSYVSVIFSATDTQKVSTPIYIKVDSNGTYVINTGTRIVQSITVANEKKSVIKNDSIGLVATRNIIKKTDSTHLESSTTVIQKQKQSSRFPIQIVAGIVALLVLIAVGWYMKSKLKLQI